MAKAGKRVLNRLSARKVTTMTKPGRHPDGGGLYLVIDKGGAKRWAFLFTLQGRAREMGLARSRLSVWRPHARKQRAGARNLPTVATRSCYAMPRNAPARQ